MDLLLSKRYVIDDLVFHIRELDAVKYETKKPKGNKAALMQELFDLLNEHIDDVINDDDENPPGKDYTDSTYTEFDGNYPDEFGKYVAELPMVVSVSSKFGWDHVMVRGKQCNDDDMHTSSHNWMVYWGNRQYSVSEWNQQLNDWDNAYGSKEVFRKKISMDVIKECWRKLAPVFQPHEYTQAGGKAIAEQFRVDIFGNVVMMDAAKQSMTYMVVDHVFPHSRGGRSVIANYMGLHEVANLIKSNHILQSLCPALMRVGFSTEDIRALVFSIVASDDYVNVAKTRGAKAGCITQYTDILKKPLCKENFKCSYFMKMKCELVKDNMSVVNAMKRVLKEVSDTYSPSGMPESDVPVATNVAGGGAGVAASPGIASYFSPKTESK